VVTGASSGIGAATAQRLAREGFEVVLGARRAERIERLASQIGARSHPLDVTDDASVEAFCATLDRCDVLVNNAGGGPRRLAADVRHQRARRGPDDPGAAAGARRLR
jgi:NADP-dependent 3-hydroxy acid dehydrogenase YdfG